MNKKIRVRFAPSPTGPLHIGGLRTALFNYLFARRNNGTFILRIEDTDQARYVKGAEEYIIEALGWCNIHPDEGPYRQSERREIYRSYAEELVEKGFAYYAFDTPEALEALRNEYESRGETFTYDAKARGRLRNSLTLDKTRVADLLEAGEPCVIRFLFPENEEIVMEDIIRGTVTVNTSTLDDKVLFKADGMPTYHLANVVDDHLMEISHVIRGEEWLPSLPLHVAMYRALGWERSMPEFAHLPLIMKPSGKGKLSKRDGDKGGFPVFPLEWIDPDSGDISTGYREEGYFPEACINMLAFLGWNPGTEQEIFSMEELERAFSLEKVGKGGARFDPEKAAWYNHQYLQTKADPLLAELFQPWLEEKGVNAEKEMVTRVIGLVKERVSFIKELWGQSSFFFRAPDTYDPQMVQKRWRPESPEQMEILIKELMVCEPFTAQAVETCVKTCVESRGMGMGAIMSAWRLLLVGAAMGPGLFEIAETIGREEVIQRMRNGIVRLKH